MGSAAKVTMASGGVLAGASAAGTLAGFTSSGIAAGSLAAAAQATAGNVAAGSLFATAQSLGASGAIAALGPIGVGVLVVGGAAYYFSSWFTYHIDLISMSIFVLKTYCYGFNIKSLQIRK